MRSGNEPTATQEHMANAKTRKKDKIKNHTYTQKVYTEYYPFVSSAAMLVT